MSLTPVPPPRCTSCGHVAHKGDCAGHDDGSPCKCGVSTLPFADHHLTAATLERIEAMLGKLASRVEYLIGEVLQHHEAVRRVPVLEAEVVALRERFVAHDEWERTEKARANGGRA